MVVDNRNKQSIAVMPLTLDGGRQSQRKHLKMKKLLLLPILAMTVVLAGPAQAGETTTSYKNVTQAPAEVYGTGFYFAFDLGANLYQDRGDTRFFTNGFGDTLSIDPNNDVGFFGGIKLGYVFGTGTVRFALEEDMFYNGWKTGTNSTLVQDGVITQSSSNVTINTGAFMTNGLVRFGTGKFQPYIGGGLGVYYAESAGGNIGRFNFGGGGNHTDFAWQVIAGADYYWTPKISTFMEYKFLEYTAYNADFGNDDRVLGQQLLGAGFRFHF